LTAQHASSLTGTDAYDVNVSPDKRTILLHDQNTLLESLKVLWILDRGREMLIFLAIVN
jgi:hypothetical protein